MAVMAADSRFFGTLLCAVGIIGGADIEEVIETAVPVTALSSARSRIFEMKRGDLVRVAGRRTGSATGVFGIEAYVYTADKILVAKDDTDTDHAYFEWKSPNDQSYYVLVRNISSADGTFSVTLLRGSKAGVAIENTDFATVKIYYATNRMAAPGGGKSAPYYSPEMQIGDSYSLGSALVTIPRDHKLGELEGPAIYRLEFTPNPTKHVVLSKVVPEDASGRFFGEIRERIAGMPHKQAFVFVHGFNMTFEEAMRRTAQIAYDLGYTGAPIAFSWASQGSALAYLHDVTTADASAAALRAFLVDLSEKSGATTIHLIAHSMGNRVLGRALETMASGSASAPPHFREIALLAPDVDAELLRQMSAAIRSRADRVTLYSSSHDEALRLSSKLAGKPRAGQKVQLISGIESIDASPANTSLLGLSHSYYGDSSSVLGDLFRLLQGDPPDTRFGLERVQSAQGVYWRFKRVAR